MRIEILVTIGVCLGLCANAGLAQADGLSGVYRTESGDTGNVLHVTFGACDADTQLTCAVITRALNSDQEPMTDYAHLGKAIVWGMKKIGRSKYAGGKIWDPSADKIYKSKMFVRSNSIRVSGCVGPICKAQSWVKVK